jgi:hypothetical protein
MCGDMVHIEQVEKFTLALFQEIRDMGAGEKRLQDLGL